MIAFALANGRRADFGGNKMSQGEAVRFIDAVEADEVFAQQLEALKESPEQVLALVRAGGFVVEPDEVRDALLERYGSELNEEQLAAIAGGHRLEIDDPGFIALSVATLGIAAISAAF